MRICVCDVGVGNVRNVLRAVERAAPSATIVATRDPDAIAGADRLIVPGQGSFGALAEAMRGGLGEALSAKIRSGAPYLGICLGLQILFEGSEEAPGAPGLSLLPGRVRRLRPERALPLPHIGWNVVEATPASDASFPGGGRYFYFAHSFVAEPVDRSVVAATTDYGEPFVSAVRRENVLAVQFHPEKSQRAGLSLLERWLR